MVASLFNSFSVRFSVFLLTFIGVAVSSVNLNAETVASFYYWRSTEVVAAPGKPATAQLLTLFCAGCAPAGMERLEIPLVAVLRDTLGDDDPSNDKVTAVWLLTYSRPSLTQKAASAVPFFYWRLGKGSANVAQKDTAPLLDLSTPEHPAISGVGQQLLQWTTLDTFDPSLRATSRAYRTNQTDHERFHLEEANSYLLHAPTTGGSESLTREQRDFVMARLELRKTLLGGFVADGRATVLGQQAIYQQEEVRSRNWELLRQCAEKTGLLFEPLSIGQSTEEYGILWFPSRAAGEPAGKDLAPIWKLLNLKNPYTDDRLSQWQGLTQNRSLDANGSLLPPGDKGLKEVTLIPLGVYNLNYPHVPLLMIDFRDKRRLRRNELVQQTINEVTAGIIGVSHFTNWYYFVGADFYNFYQGRHGKATSRAERLDCYSQLRSALSLDRNLDGDLRQEMQRRMDSLSINPLEASDASEMKAAISRYALLQGQASGSDSRLWKRLDSDRRQELADFGESTKRQVVDLTLHAVTMGSYNHKAKPQDGNLALLDAYRQVEYHLAFLDRLASAGTAPEVAYREERIRASVSALSGLMPQVNSPIVRAHASQTLDRLSKLPDDQTLRADCQTALLSLRNSGSTLPGSVPGLVASPALEKRP